MAAVEGECFLHFDEANFTQLPSQTNIYGMTKIESEENCSKVLLASLRGGVVCVDYSNQALQPGAREVSFTYIPGDAEIVSIDAFNRRSEASKGLVIGISLILLKNVPHRQEQFLNIYSAVENGSEFNLDSIAQGCQHIGLNFVPFQLTHTETIIKGERETMFLLGGSDNCIHMFCEDTSHQRFEEHPVRNVFPELHDLPSNVLWLDIQQMGENRRLTALGCQNGYVQIAMVDFCNEPNIVYKTSADHDGPISSVRLFNPISCGHNVSHDTMNAAPERLVNQSKDTAHEDEAEAMQFHLLVSCTIEPCVVYVNVTNKGLSSMVTLPDSDSYDCVVCSCVADVDWDGVNEIILGTYGQELLVYKSCKLDSMAVTVTHPNLEFRLLWKRSFATPLFALEYTDLTNDGLRELVVASLSGLHILQHNLEEAEATCEQRMKGIQGSHSH